MGPTDALKHPRDDDGQQNDLGERGKKVDARSPRLQGVALGPNNSRDAGQTSSAAQARGGRNESRNLARYDRPGTDSYRPRSDSYRPGNDRSANTSQGFSRGKLPSFSRTGRGRGGRYEQPRADSYRPRSDDWDAETELRAMEQRNRPVQEQQYNRQTQNSDPSPDDLSLPARPETQQNLRGGRWDDRKEPQALRQSPLNQPVQQQQHNHPAQNPYNHQYTAQVQKQRSQWQGYGYGNAQGQQQPVQGQWQGYTHQHNVPAQQQQAQWQGYNQYFAQGHQPVQFPYPYYPNHTTYPYQPPVPTAAPNYYQTPQVRHAPQTTTLPGGGVSLLAQSEENRPPAKPAANNWKPSSRVGGGQTHPTGWTSINEHSGIASVLLNPKFSSPPRPSNESTAMHGPGSQSPAKSPGKHSRDVKVFTTPPPQPTEQYLKQASKEPRRTLAPQLPMQLLILDLNGTLVYRPDRRNMNMIIPRPFLAPFLEFIFENFAVMVWSSAQPANVNLMVNKVLDATYSPMLLAKWNRSNFGLTAAEYVQNVQVYKQLTRVWGDESLCGMPSCWGQHNTILIDDTLLKAAAEPYNLLEIPEFAATEEQMKSDVLREVAGYLDELTHQEDVSAFIKRRPFKADGTWNMKWSDKLADGGVKL